MGAKTPGTFHFLKKFTRTIRKAITTNQVKKAEFDLEEAHEELLLAKKIAEQNSNDEKATQKAEQAIEKFEARMEKIKQRAEEIKQNNPENSDAFLEKIADAQIKQQKMLDNLEAKLPEQAFAKIEQARTRALEHASEIFTKIAQNKEQIAEKINQAMENQNGSELKDLKNMEIMERLREHMPEETKAAIEKAQEMARQRFQEKLSQIPEEERAEKIEKYIENTKGNAITQMKVLEGLSGSAELPKNLNAQIEKAIQKTIEKFETKMEKMEQTGQTEVFLKNIESGDIKTMEAVQRIRQNMPEDIKAQIDASNQKAMENLKTKIESSENSDEFQKIKEQLEANPQIQKAIQQRYNDFNAELKSKQQEMEKIRNQAEIKQQETKAQNQNQAPKNTQDKIQEQKQNIINKANEIKDKVQEQKAQNTTASNPAQLIKEIQKPEQIQNMPTNQIQNNAQNQAPAPAM